MSLLIIILAKQYINDRDRFKLIKLDKYLVDIDIMYVPFWGPTKWEINNIVYIVITLYQTCNPALTKNPLEDRMIYTYCYDITGKEGKPVCYQWWA